MHSEGVRQHDVRAAVGCCWSYVCLYPAMHVLVLWLLTILCQTIYHSRNALRGGKTTWCKSCRCGLLLELCMFVSCNVCAGLWLLTILCQTIHHSRNAFRGGKTMWCKSCRCGLLLELCMFVSCNVCAGLWVQTHSTSNHISQS